MKAGTGVLGMYIEVERQQRAALLLRDVAYVIEAHLEVIGGEDNVAKHLDQFNRRARAGQCFTRPYFGTRECAADFALIESDKDLPVTDVSLIDGKPRDMGWVLHDIDYQNARQPKFFHAQMTDGLIVVPPLHSAEVRS